MEAQPREAPHCDAIDPVPSIVGKVRERLRVNAFGEPPHRRQDSMVLRDEGPQSASGRSSFPTETANGP
jgi:hypothetical protein